MLSLARLKTNPRLNWYTLLLGASLITVIYLFDNWHISKQFIGIVERRTHQVGTQEAGRIQNLLVQVGDRVERGQVLATLDATDLLVDLELLTRSLSGLEAMTGVQRNLNAIAAQKTLLELNNEAAELTERVALYQSKNAELSGLNLEIARLREAEEAGLGYSRDLTDLVLKRDALAGYIAEQGQDIEHQRQQLDVTRESRNTFKSSDLDSLSQLLWVENLEYVETLKREISSNQYRLELRSLKAPCAGYLTEVLARPGDIIDAYSSALTIEEMQPQFLDIYIPESSNIEPALGMDIEIFSARSKLYNTKGQVVFIHPGFARASERVSFRGVVFWARKVRVALPKDHQLIPGEVVEVRLDGSRKQTGKNNRSAR